MCTHATASFVLFCFYLVIIVSFKILLLIAPMQIDHLIYSHMIWKNYKYRVDVWHIHFISLESVRTFTQVSVQWQDTDSMREELDDLQVCLLSRSCLEIYFVQQNNTLLSFHLLFYFELLVGNMLIYADFLKHKMGYLTEPARWDVPGEQVSSLYSWMLTSILQAFQYVARAHNNLLY